MVVRVLGWWLGWCLGGSILVGCPAKDDGDSGKASETTTDSGSESTTGESTTGESTNGDTAADDTCLPSGEACTDAAQCCAGLCRQDGVCSPYECAAEGESCMATCCGELLCDMESQTCSATCKDVGAPCEGDDACCSQACDPTSGTCAGLG